MTKYDSGERLGAKLQEFVRAANGELPIVEAAFRRVLDKLQNSQYMMSTAFLRHPNFGGGGGDKHTAVVEQFAETIAECVSKAEERVSLTGDALRLAAQEYSRADDGARTELQKLMRNDYTMNKANERRDIPNIELPL
ncbi:hypothetical protein [Plantactinospora endophytica]|nr:hypothetical protein [Plantactinospora endophytica]